MGWEDRPYYRDRGYSSNSVVNLLSGSVPLFTAFGIRVRAHNALILFILGELLLDWNKGYSLADKLVSMAALFVIIVLHEFGHCFAARFVGGSASDILLWPLGGLAFPDAPDRPGPQFWTIAGGPLVNVLICAICAPLVWLLAGHTWVSLYPSYLMPPLEIGARNPAFYFYWLFSLSYLLLLFNLLPIYPMDGGRILQTALWRFIGHYRSRMLACLIGMFGSAGLGILAVWRWDSSTLMLLLLAGWLFLSCYQERMILRETGPSEPWQTDDPDFSASLSRDEPPPRKRVNKRAIRTARKRARQEADQRQRLDAILIKVSHQGLASLTWRERRALRWATVERRKRESELKSLLEE